ncbi:MAG TPA: ATP-binding protein, partial [Bryobacteraceae bacterium]|nr:ATP-binding protein [Bryobacteraceae bacterium]
GADDYLTKPFSARELLARIQAAIKIQQIRGESNRALRESEKRLSRLVAGLTRLHQLSRTLSEATSEQPGLRSILQEMLDLHQTGRGCIWVCDPVTRAPQNTIQLGFENAPSTPDAEAALSAAARIALQENRPVLIEDTASDPAFASCRDAARALGIRTVYSFPLQNRSGECLALLSVYLDSPRLPDELQLQLSDMHCRQAADFIERLRAGQALRESEYQYRTLFNSMDEGFCTVEVLSHPAGGMIDGRIIEVNAAFEKQTGVQNAKGKRMRELVPDLEDRWFEIYGQVAQTRQSARFENEAKQLGRWYDVYAFPVDEPQLNRIAVIFNDITGRRRREEQLRQANRDLEQFAYSASHDLQEPIRTVGIYSEFLAKRHAGSLDSEGLQFLEFIRSGADRMAALVRDLLTYTQIAKLEAGPEVVDCSEPLQSALSNLDVVIHESRAEIVTAPLPALQAHRIHLQQLFQNLIGNAIKYRSPDRTPRIQVSAERQNGFWQFSIRDNGIGIDPKYQSEIFGLFKRLHGGSEYSGTGIGLAICQRIVERYGGRIWVESELGQGSTFRFTLPG